MTAAGKESLLKPATNCALHLLSRQREPFHGALLPPGLGIIELDRGAAILFTTPLDQSICRCSTAYPHKFLTGRQATKIGTIRQKGNIRSCVWRGESEYDVAQQPYSVLVLRLLR